MLQHDGDSCVAVLADAYGIRVRDCELDRVLSLPAHRHTSYPKRIICILFLDEKL